MSNTEILNSQLRGSIALEDQKALVRREPMDMISVAFEEAIKQGAAMEVVGRILDQQRWMIEHQEKVAFIEAMSKFKDEVPTIIRSRIIRDKQGDEKYKAVALEDVAGPLMKALLKHRITYRFKTDMLDNGSIKVTCYLRLERTAYEEQGSTLAAPPDISGGKDHLKGVGSTTSYLEKYTLMASCGVHVHGSDPEAVPVDGLTQGEGSEWVDKISLSDSANEAMAVWGKAIEAAKSFTPIDYKAMTIFTEARDNRLKELRRAR